MQMLLIGAAFLSLLRCASGIPIDGGGKELATRQTMAPPYFVAYSDEWVSGENGPPNPSVIYGFNVFVLSFLLSSGPADQALEWADIGAASRSSIKAQYEAAGIKLMVSAFGSTDAPTSNGENPTTVAQTMAAWVQAYDLDGVDVDYEDFNAMSAQDGSAEDWLTTFTQELRALLQPPYLITHAPVAPWFSGYSLYKTGAYIAVNNNVGAIIDWYNVQFYNQGTSEYTTCTGLLYESSSTWPNSALWQINEIGGVALQKLVIGKPANTGDASNGYMSTSTLASCLQQGREYGWGAGAMTWEYPDAEAAWIAAVRADSWPVPSPTTTSTAPGPTATGCAAVGPWNSASIYVGGDQASYDGDLWTAKWWTEGDIPGGSAGVWTDDGACTN